MRFNRAIAPSAIHCRLLVHLPVRLISRGQSFGFTRAGLDSAAGRFHGEFAEARGYF